MKAVERKTTFEDLKDSGSFPTLDAKLGSHLLGVIDGELRRRASNIERRLIEIGR